VALKVADVSSHSVVESPVCGVSHRSSSICSLRDLNKHCRDYGPSYSRNSQFFPDHSWEGCLTVLQVRRKGHVLQSFLMMPLQSDGKLQCSDQLLYSFQM